MHTTLTVSGFEIKGETFSGSRPGGGDYLAPI